MDKQFYMKEGASFQEFPSYVERTPRKQRSLFVFLVLVFLLFASLIGLYFLGKSKKSASQVVPIPTVSPSPSPSPTVGPTATPSGTLTPSSSAKATPSGPVSERSKITVAILNGSGVVGAASQISSRLKSLGYTIQTVGNADNFSYTGITVKVKSSKSAASVLLKKDLSSGSSATITTSIDDTIATDAQVIVGK